MAIKSKRVKMQEDPTLGSPFRNYFQKLPHVAAASQDAAAAANKYALYYDETANVLKFSDGSSWTALSTSTSVGTLQQVTTAGKTSSVTAVEFTGASSAANGLLVGDGTRKLQLYTDGTDSFIASASGDIKLVPAGSDVRVTGNVVASGLVSTATLSTSGLATLASCTVTGAFSAGSFSLDAVAAATPGATLKLDGEGAGGVNICSISTGGITLSDDVGVAASKALTLTGVGNSNILVVTAGDAVLSDGSLSLTDADDAASLVITNNSYVAGANGLIDINAGGIVTGTLLNMKADALTSGSMVYLETSAAGFIGKYIQCYDGAADDFSVGLYGATIIAGNASGTPALSLTAGDAKLTSGHVELTSGDVKVTAGKLDIAEGVVEVDSAIDTQCYFVRNQGTTTKDWVHIETSAASDDHCALSVTCASTGAVDAIEVAYAGTEHGLKIVPSDVAGSAICGQCAVNATDCIIKVDGSTNNWIGGNNVGMLQCACDGALAHANASCFYIAYSGAGAASGMGTSLRILDTGSTATAYATYISAATGEALKVDAGKCTFDEACTFAASNVNKVAPNFIAAGGVNNAITLALVDADGANVAVADGLRVVVDLGAITLQAGANTCDLNGGGAVGIVSHRNPAANIGVAYVANSFIELVYNSTSSVWMDMSQ